RSLRVHVEGKDELPRLVDNINQMLDSSSASQAEPVNAHAELALRNQMVMETNQALQNEIQERRRVERALQARTRQQERLIDTARQLTASLDVRQVLEAIGRSAREILEADGCSIYLLKEDGRTLTPVVAIGEVYGEEILSVALDIDASLTGQAVKARHGLIFNDASSNPCGFQIPGTPAEVEERVIVAPFIAEDQVLGAMCLDRNQRDFLEEELALAETFAAYASTALKNAQAHDRLQREVDERRLAEAALRESEERYRSLVHNIPIGIYRTSPGPRGEFLMANPAFLAMTGYASEEELKQVCVADMYELPADRVAFSQTLLATGRIDGQEMRLRRKDGNLLWGSVTAIVSTDTDGQPYFNCSMIDVTQHRQAEKVQNALYQISQATLTASNLVELYGIVHSIIGELIMARNFYVALYDSTSNIISFPYFVDEYDPPPSPAKMGRRLTDYLIRLGQPLLLTPEGFIDLIQRGEIDSYGAPSLDWLGVPLKTAENRTIGCMVVQTYDEGARYSENDRELLTIVSTQIALAIERKRSEEALKDQRAFLEQVIDINPNLIFAMDHDGRFILANQALASLYGTTVPKLIGKTEADFNPNFAEVEAFRQDDREVIHKLKEKFIPEEKVTDASGRVRWLQAVKRPLILASDQVHVLGVATDITERKFAEDQLTHNAFHDSLTGLPNRALFMDRLQHAIQRNKRRKDGWFTVLFLDLDRFKTVNDSLGHVLGDQLLIAAARRLQTCLRTSDTIARFGGDEFVILLEDLESREDATQVAERILLEMTEPFTLAGHQMVITTSIGVVFSTQGYKKPEEMLRDADIAMYRAKEQGRRQYVVFNSAMRAYVTANLELESDLRYALDHQELEVHYQPIYSVKSVRMIGFEALVRWRHPKRGLVRPAEFIPFAEETGLIIPIGRWVLQEACRQMHAWHVAFPTQPPLTVSVNLSNKQFSQTDFFTEVRQALDETGLDPHALRLEITESVIMDNPELAIDILNRLQSLGVEVHIDDFGTGYSSLLYLHMLPINAIKIDRSFISGSGMQANGMEIIQTIIKLAHELKVDAIAEGVETQEQFDRLSSLDCEYVQGYLLSHCLESQAVEKLLQEGS
ncbi:MAG: EAL domain-containing protein, partial [Anaerolineales bacterium]|nr:EAL domain-containing protein [Anaerolineales bacterium]